MTDPVSNNYSLTLPTVGGDSGTWGTVLNSGVITVVDAALGANFSTVITSADVTLTTTQFQNAIFVVSGTLTGNRNLIVPLSPNSTTAACGGRFVVVNNGAGAFNLSVKTATTGSSAVVPQGFAAALYSDGVNVKSALDGLPGYAKASNGTPSSLPGTAGSVNTNASLAYDYANNKLYVCTTSSTTAATWMLPVTAIPAPPTFYTPDVQVFTSGTSQTYTTPTNGGNRPLFLRVRMVGGGGGGGAQSANSGSAGGDTSFDSWTAIHGAGGAPISNGGTGGSGGAAGTGTLITRVSGGNGGASNAAGGGNPAGGNGGVSFFGGAGVGIINGVGTAAAANSGSGGGGASTSSGNGSGGGGAGEFVEFIITSPAASYTYTVGALGAGGAAGNVAGSNGAAGRIEVIGYWQ